MTINKENRRASSFQSHTPSTQAPLLSADNGRNRKAASRCKPVKMNLKGKYAALGRTLPVTLYSCDGSFSWHTCVENP